MLTSVTLVRFCAFIWELFLSECSKLLFNTTVEWRYNRSNLSWHFIQRGHDSNRTLIRFQTTDTPYLALTGELWGVYYENFEETWPRYNGITLYLIWWVWKLFFNNYCHIHLPGAHEWIPELPSLSLSSRIQLTPASSLWAQLWIPQVHPVHSCMLMAFSGQEKLSSQISPDPSPLLAQQVKDSAPLWKKENV